jgi:WD40 repeat protein
MFALRITLSLSVVTLLGGCAVTTQTQLDSRRVAMEVNSKVPPPPVITVDFSPDGKYLVTGGSDGISRLWDLTVAREAMQFKESSGFIKDVNYLPDGKTIAVATDVGATLWDVATGSRIRKLSGNFGGKLSISPDGRSILGRTRFALSIERAKVKLLNVQSGAVLWEFNGSGGKISPNGKFIVVEGIENKGNFIFPKYEFFLSLQNMDAGGELWRITERVGALAFSPNSRKLLVSHIDFDGRDLLTSFKLFDTLTGQLEKEFGEAKIRGDGGFSSKHLSQKVKALAFSSDGKQFLSGDQTGNYKLWDVATGTMVRQFESSDESDNTLTYTPPSIKFSPDSKMAAIVLLGSIKLFDVSTGEELVTIISFEGGEWFATTPEGYYNSSEKGDKYLSVTIGGELYSISQLRESFYRPDIVKAALDGRALTGLRNMADIKPPPAVAIINTPASVSSDQTTVFLKVKDQGGGIGDVRLYLNDTAVVLDRGSHALSFRADTPRTFSYPLQMISGKNSLRAIAFNADNSMQSTDALYEIEATTAVMKPVLHAVVVGIQEYENPKLTLKYPVADTKLFADTLNERAAGLFDTVSITRLTTRQETTSASVIATLNAMSTEVGPDDLFVLYVASQATVDKGEYFLITSNVGSTSTEKLKSDALSLSNLKELLSNIPATKKLIVLDTCDVGKLSDAAHTSTLAHGMSEDTALKVLSRAVGSTIISATDSPKEELEGYLGHGLFAYVLSNGLQGKADLNKDGFVKTTELASYIESEVPYLADLLLHRKQYPISLSSGQEYPVVKLK